MERAASDLLVQLAHKVARAVCILQCCSVHFADCGLTTFCKILTAGACIVTFHSMVVTKYQVLYAEAIQRQQVMAF